MPRLKKQSTLDLERLRAIGSQRPDLLTHAEIQTLASGGALTRPSNGRRTRRSTRKASTRSTKRKSAKLKIPKALEKAMVIELNRQKRPSPKAA